LLEKHQALQELTSRIDEYLREAYPDFFGDSPSHPVLPLKPYKVIHDSLWGTNRFTWRELVLIDSPIIQRLRGIHQVGLVHKIYPSAHHTRFEHALGVVVIASRVFESVVATNSSEISNIQKAIAPKSDFQKFVAQIKQELRLAALLHDCGHSLYSHTSERVYQDLDILQKAVVELSDIVGKEKGAGEVISFCIAQTEAIKRLLDRAGGKLGVSVEHEELIAEIDLTNVALIIVGRARHPYLQFLGDIVSSGLDADKLDYLLRDAKGAGLPIRYDLERYLYAVRVHPETLTDGEGKLEILYQTVGSNAARKEATSDDKYPHFDTYRIRLDRAGINSFEQIVICKMMLYGYLYHHPKVRAAEGMLERLLKRMLAGWRNERHTDSEILCRFLDLTDSAIDGPEFRFSKSSHIRMYSYRIANRLLPREVYRFGGTSASHAEGALLKDFLLDLQDHAKGPYIVEELERKIGQELINNNESLGNSPEEALTLSGVWVDVPKVPKFEDTDTLLTGDGTMAVQFSQIFPVGHWTQAYTSHRYFVRIFAFSEYFEDAVAAGKTALQMVTGIKGDDFYHRIRRIRK
jgi:uncharacterized protein